jgi:hypothetical protein
VDGEFLDASEVARFLEDTHTVLLSESGAPALKPTSLRYQLAGNLSTGTEYGLVGKKANWGNDESLGSSQGHDETRGDPSVVSSSGNMR